MRSIRPAKIAARLWTTSTYRHGTLSPRHFIATALYRHGVYRHGVYRHGVYRHGVAQGALTFAIP
jgi:hypothetical protein